MNIQEVLNRVINQTYFYQGYHLVSARLRGYGEHPPIVKLEVVFKDEATGETFKRLVPLELFLMDAGFWQSFTNSMGWVGFVCSLCGHVECDHNSIIRDMLAVWLFQWNRLIRMLAEGKYPGDYFSSL